MRCRGFLGWAAPRLHLRAAGFDRVAHQACKRIGKRLRELGLADVAAYQAYLEGSPDEWRCLDALCRITISRFYRDRAVFDGLADVVLPTLAQAAVARGERELRCWSAGCASGEEPYSLSVLWLGRVQARFPLLHLHIRASDADAYLLDRARAGQYPSSALRELPADLRELGFETDGALCRLRPQVADAVELVREDLRGARPIEAFDLILCRNLAFTYFDDSLQREVLARLLERLRPGGGLVIGTRERLPEGHGLVPWTPAVFRRR